MSGKLDLRLYEFSPAIEALKDKLEDNIDIETGEYVGTEPIEDLMLDIASMEHSKKEKILDIGKLILYYKKMVEIHDEIAAKHKRKSNSAEKAREMLVEYIKGNTSNGEKFKDAYVSIYDMHKERVQPLKTVEETPVAYLRASLVKDYPRDVVDRIQKSCLKQNLPAPFTFEHDKEALKAAFKDCETNGVQFDLAKLEKNRSVVVR